MKSLYLNLCKTCGAILTDGWFDRCDRCRKGR